MEKVRKYVAMIKAGYLKQAYRELKWIYHFAGRYRSSVILITGLRIVCAALNMSLVIPERSLVDAVVAAEWSTVIRSALLVIAIGTTNITLTTIVNRKIGKTGAQIKKEVAGQTYDRIMRADWETVVQHHSGDLLTRVQEDVANVSSSTVGWIPMVIYSGIQVLLAVVYIVYFDISMLVPMLLMAPLMIIWPRKYLGRQYGANQRERKIASGLMALYKESFQHLQSIKGFGLIDLFGQKMDRQLEQRRDAETEVNRYGVTAWVIMYSSGELAAALCLAWAVYRVYQGRLTLGTLVLMITAAGTLSNALKEMMNQLPAAISTISSSERLRGLLELSEEKVENAPAYDRMSEQAKKDGISVSIRNLDFSYADGTEVLRGVNCDVQAGEIVAFVGPSGEGKTTMLRILLGIVHTQNPPLLESGGMSLPVSPAARRLMAYVPQGNTMLNGTIAENMRAFRQNATDEEIVAALKEACAYEFVEKLPDGINHNVGESGIGFSEGQNQRLAIARALMCETPILLLDEATSALDVATERRVLNSLMKGDRKRTCILTTHRPSVLSMCSRVYRIASKSVRPVGEDEVRQIMNEF